MLIENFGTKTFNQVAEEMKALGASRLIITGEDDKGKVTRLAIVAKDEDAEFIYQQIKALEED